MDDPQQTAGSKSPPDKGIDPRQITITANYQLVEKKELKLVLAVKNEAPRDIFLFNRLWTLNKENRRVPDPEQVYRFAAKGVLRLHFGLAPLPRFADVTYRNLSEMTLLANNKTFEAQYVIPVPVAEYNVYYERTTDENSQQVPVEQIEVILEFVAASETVKVKPSTFHEGAFELVSPESLKEIQLARSEPKKLGLTALRRTDEFSRVVLPGEKPEPLAP